ncbi:hypothetical protein GXW83_01650 [Streptacidiphilus sp. PB12-B1b]|uniref:type II secretion system F family protein n=1 Tax=Streptacidiphilus sp. PB12-B1b TaxID=2705012 RepID=UPI0015FDC4DF|nr:type II secretion system F family protein [Streptacidiphilus sp. PB12-B1b]QMU74677.1 hypothetical protein GXW83_01650 [Streptacidiphilus sp. PB12-B1b]
MHTTEWTTASAGGALTALLGGAVRALRARCVLRGRARAVGMPVHRPRRGGRRGSWSFGRPGGRLRLPPGFGRYGAGLLLGTGVAVSFHGLRALLAGVLVAAACCRWLPERPTAEERRAQAESAALRAQLPLTADLLAGCLASWCAPATAAEAVAGAVAEPMATRLAEAAADLRMGGDAEESWARFGSDPALAPLGRCLARACASGAPPAAGLARLAEGSRASAAAAAQQRARRAGVLATAPLGLCFLPAFVLIGVVPVVTGLAGTFLVHT